MRHNGLLTKYGAGGIRQPYVHPPIFPNFAGEERQNSIELKTTDKWKKARMKSWSSGR